MTGDDLVRCPDIGRAIAVKACLRRRQEQRLQTKIIRAASDRYGPRVTEQVPVGPLYPACAGCGLGEANAAAELVAEATPPQPRADPRPGSHLWGGEVPDVPIGPPPNLAARRLPPNWRNEEPVAEGTVQSRSIREANAASDEVEKPAMPEVVHRGSAAPEPHREPGGRPPALVQEVVHHEPPAEPAQEATMPRGKREKPCNGCGATGMRHRKGCTGEQEAPAAAPTTRKAAKPPRRPLEAKPFRELAELRGRLMVQMADIDEEFAARRDELQDVGPAAPARLVAAEARATG